ncbi:YdaU family protein [Burkholderia multivorans]|nr:YdaU family protein [Burkholderia multivorans]
MNFYKRHIGDYLKDTAHLSLLEHGVYTRLLDVYYTRESGIPDDQAARLIGARARDEVAALKVVLGEFFELVDGTWIQQRCEREIADAAEGEVDRDAKRENERERQRRHRDRRKKLFDELRKHDIVPPYDTSTEQLQAILSRVTNRDDETDKSRHVTQPVTRDATANQTPEAISQTPYNPLEASSQLQTEIGAPAPNSASSVSRAVEIAVYLRQRGIIGANSVNPNIAAWADDVRVTNEILDAALSIVAARQLEKPVGPNYLVGIITDLLNPKPVQPKREDNSWKRTPAGVERKASELGVVCPPGRDHAWLLEKCESVMRQRAREVAA